MNLSEMEYSFFLFSFSCRALESERVKIVVQQDEEFSVPSELLRSCSPSLGGALASEFDGTYRDCIHLPNVSADIFSKFLTWLYAWDIEYDFSVYLPEVCFQLAMFGETYKIDFFVNELVDHIGHKDWIPTPSDLDEVCRLLPKHSACRAMVIFKLAIWYDRNNSDLGWVGNFDKFYAGVFDHYPGAKDMFHNYTSAIHEHISAQPDTAIEDGDVDPCLRRSIRPSPQEYMTLKLSQCLPDRQSQGVVQAPSNDTTSRSTI